MLILKPYVLPDYKNSIVNLTASLLEYYSVKSGYRTIGAVDRPLEKEYKNVVVMVFDGMGTKILEHALLKDSFMLGNNVTSMTSVFPSTTTAAMTAYYTGVSPNEHGWIGWSLFFKEYARMIDIFRNQDSFSGQEIADEFIAKKIMPYESIFSKIKRNNPDVGVYTLQPRPIDFPSNGNTNIAIDTLQDIFKNVQDLCSGNGRNFIFSYWDKPDGIMHTTGCYSDDAVGYINTIDQELLKMTSSLKDTLLIVTADHGQTQIFNEYFINDYPELMDCLINPPSIEVRAVSFFIKPDKMAVFKKLFSKIFKNEFLLLTRKEVLRKKLLGHGESHRKITDFIGDYVAIGIGNSILRYTSPSNKPLKHFFGHHAGLTASEMLIPLIIKEIR
jgi:hypothetical protein